MIATVSAMFPVLLVVLVGYGLRKKQVLSANTVSELKFLLIHLILPVAVFNALATARYSVISWMIVRLMFAVLVVSFLLGFLLRPLISEPFKKYLPFVVSVYEGGMVALPLYSELCGSENLFRIAIMEIAAVFFGYGIYMNLLTFMERGEKPVFSEIVRRAFRNPNFIASLLGVLAGVSGIFAHLMASRYAVIYTGVVRTVTAPLSAMILLVVGYSIELDREVLVPALKTIVIRVLLQGVMIVLMLMAVHRIMPPDQLTDLAILIYMSAPATFSLQSFIKDQRGAGYASTVSALYVFISIMVYAAAYAFV